MGWKDEEEAVEALDGVCSMTDIFGSEIRAIAWFFPGSKINRNLLYTIYSEPQSTGRFVAFGRTVYKNQGR